MVRASQGRNDPTGLGQGVELPHEGMHVLIRREQKTAEESEDAALNG